MAPRKTRAAATVAPEFQTISPRQVARLSPALQAVASELASIRFFAASATAFSSAAVLTLATIRPLVVRPLRRLQAGDLPRFELLAGLRTLRTLEAANIDCDVPAVIISNATEESEAAFAVMDSLGCTILDMPRRRALRPLSRLFDAVQSDPSLLEALCLAVPALTNPAALAKLLDVSPSDISKLEASPAGTGTEDLEDLLPSSSANVSSDSVEPGLLDDGTVAEGS